MWTRVIGGTGTFDYYNSVNTCLDGTYLFAGATDSYGAGTSDGVFSRIGPGGEVTCNRITHVINVSTVTLNSATFSPTSVSQGVASYSNPGILHYGQSTTACSDFVGLEEPSVESVLNIYPNPVATTTTITIEQNDVHPGSPSTVEIVDACGKLKSSVPFNGSSITLDVSMYPPGIYFIRMESESNCWSEKLVVVN